MKFMVSAMKLCTSVIPKKRPSLPTNFPPKRSKLIIDLSSNYAQLRVISSRVFHSFPRFQGLIAVTLCCLVLSSLSAPAPQPIWPGLVVAGTGAVAFDVATGLTLLGAGGATIPTSLLVAKALAPVVAAKKIAILAALAAQQRDAERR